MAKNTQPITVETNVRLRFALREALHQLDNIGAALGADGQPAAAKPLPSYLTVALLRFNEALAKQIVREILIPKVESGHHAKGKPRTKAATTGKGSLEATAEDLGLSISTVERFVHGLTKPDLVATSPGGKLVSVTGSDGFWAIRVDGEWTNKPVFPITVGELADFDAVADSKAALKLASEARKHVPNDD